MPRYAFVIPAILMLSACATGGDKQPTRPDVVIHMPLPSGNQEADSIDSAPCSLQAETALSKPSLVLEDLLQAADEYNPEIRAAREETVFSARLWQTEPQFNSTTECQAEVMQRYNDSSAMSKFKFFPIKGTIIPEDRKQSVADTAGSAEAESRMLRVERKRREVFGQVHALFIELLYFRQAQALYQQLIQDAREMNRVASLRKDFKTVSHGDAPESEIELLEFERASLRLTRDRQTYSQRLEALLGGMPVPEERFSGELISDFPPVEPAALFSSLEEHPELLAARKEAEAMACRLNQEKAQNKTDVDFRLGIGRVDGDRSVMGRLSVPLPEFGRKNGNTKRSTEEAEYLAQKTSDAVSSVEQKLRAELAAAQSEYLSAQERLAVSRDQIVPNAETAFAQTQEEYHDGKRSLHSLVDARLAVFKARLSYLAQLRDCNLAHARIVNLTSKTTGP